MSQGGEAPEARRSSECLLCPSAQPEMPGSRVLGVIAGNAAEPQVAYLNEHLPVSPDVLALAGQVPPTQVFRFAAQCDERACMHFDGKDCKLATRIVRILPAVVDALPACRIRSTCRWYQQEGRPACFRCPQVVTLNYQPSESLRLAAEGPKHDQVSS